MAKKHEFFDFDGRKVHGKSLYPTMYNDDAPKTPKKTDKEPGKKADDHKDPFLDGIGDLLSGNAKIRKDLDDAQKKLRK